VERRERQNPCDSSVPIRVHPWLKNTPHPRSSVAQHSGFQGEFHPSPPSPLPFQGRGVLSTLSSARTNTQSSPRPRNGGEGSGVRGQWHPCHRKADQRKWKGEDNGTPAIHPCESVFIRGCKNSPDLPSSVAQHSGFQVSFTPHPRPLSPFRGEGC